MPTDEEKRKFLLAVAAGCEEAADNLSDWDPWNWEKCALGWARQMPGFNAPGMTFEDSPCPGRPHFAGGHGLHAIRRFLGLDLSLVRSIFGSSHSIPSRIRIARELAWRLTIEL